MRLAFIGLLVVALLSACGDDPANTLADKGSDEQPDSADSVVPDTQSSPSDVGKTPAGDGPTSETANATDSGGSSVDPGTAPPCQCEDDGNLCTKDECDANGVCVHPPLKSIDCVPAVSISEPDRAFTLNYQGNTVKVSGVASSPIGPLQSLTLNGASLAQAPNGAFVGAVAPQHGINIIDVEATDSQGVSSRLVQSFLSGQAFYPTTLGPLDDALVPGGVVLSLGQEVWDDDDLTDLDDAATLVHKMMEGLDVLSVMTNPIVPGEDDGILWCNDWVITIKDISYEVKNVDLDPIQGALLLTATLQDLWVSFDAVDETFACPDAKGGIASIKEVKITSQLNIALVAKGQLQVTVGFIDVELKNPNVEVQDGAAAFIAWMAKWFKGTFAEYLEESVEALVKEQLGPLIEMFFKTFSDYQLSFEIPPLPMTTNTVNVTVHGQAAGVKLTPDGTTLELGISVTSPKAVPSLKSPGSIRRQGCFGGTEKPVVLPTDAPIALAIHYDVLNQAIFAAWWGGLAHLDLDSEALTELVGELPFSGVQVQLDPLLPPVVTNCLGDSKSHLQLGDLGIKLTFLVEGEPATVSVFASADFVVEVKVAPGTQGAIDLSLVVHSVDFVDFYVVDVSGVIAGAEDFIQKLLEDVAGKMVVDLFAGGVMHGFPIPKIDIGGKIPGIAEGTYLTIVPTSKTIVDGYIIISGKIVAQ